MNLPWAPVEREDEYLAEMKEKCSKAFGEALQHLQPAEIGFARVLEFGVGFNRRTVTRSGTFKTQMPFLNDDALYTEGPVDPEVAVWQVRSTQGIPLGAIIQFACHPINLGGTKKISSVWPGLLSTRVEGSGTPVCFLTQVSYEQAATRLNTRFIV
jgi:neutral ceramidase